MLLGLEQERFEGAGLKLRFHVLERHAHRSISSTGLLIGQRVTPKVLLEHGFQFQHETLATALPEVLGPRA